MLLILCEKRTTWRYYSTDRAGVGSWSDCGGPPNKEFCCFGIRGNHSINSALESIANHAKRISENNRVIMFQLLAVTEAKGLEPVWCTGFLGVQMVDDLL